MPVFGARPGLEVSGLEVSGVSSRNLGCGPEIRPNWADQHSNGDHIDHWR